MISSLASPIIVVGMHRSGTSFLMRSLISLGLYGGWWRDGNAEALFFQNLNIWIMDQFGATWDFPGSARRLEVIEDARELTLDYLRLRLRGPRALSFLGPHRYLACGGVPRLAAPWGWKDPRNTFTLPIWLRLFPEAKVVHIHRHGVDVALSLKNRAHQHLLASKRRYPYLKPLYLFGSRRARFIQSTRCVTLEGGFSLWEEYMSEARGYATSLGERMMEIGYDGLLSRPREGFESLARFAGLDADPRRLDEIVTRADASAVGAHASDPEAREFAARASARLAAFGY